jgi:hypothetical protein
MTRRRKIEGVRRGDACEGLLTRKKEYFGVAVRRG